MLLRAKLINNTTDVFLLEDVDTMSPEEASKHNSELAEFLIDITWYSAEEGVYIESDGFDSFIVYPGEYIVKEKGGIRKYNNKLFHYYYCLQ